MNKLLLMCRIAGRQAAIPATRVKSVIEIEAITVIPGTPDFIVGLTALRSQALTVIDCRRALGFEKGAVEKGTRAAVVEVEGHLYALAVDEAHDVVEANGDSVPVSGGLGLGWQKAALGMVETASGPAVLIDIEKLVQGPLVEAA